MTYSIVDEEAVVVLLVAENVLTALAIVEPTAADTPILVTASVALIETLFILDEVVVVSNVMVTFTALQSLMMWAKALF